jgi:hypothetical protein
MTGMEGAKQEASELVATVFKDKDQLSIKDLIFSLAEALDTDESAIQPTILAMFNEKVTKADVEKWALAFGPIKKDDEIVVMEKVCQK